MDGSLLALDRLARALPTVVYSQASQRDYQMDRIRRAGVMEILPPDRVVVTPRKTRESFLDTLGEFGVEDPRATVMIGNSIRSDVNPALSAGASAILVEPYEMWQYDNVAPVADGFPRFQTFPDAVDFLLR
jgi:putative hydrolase of the HAD superfamily